MTDFFR